MTTLQKIPMSAYLASDALSASDAWALVPENGTPYAWKFRKDNGISDFSAATNLGDAGHEAVFEPEIFDKKWSWYPGTRTRKKNPDDPDNPLPSGAYAEWIAETGNDDRYVLSEDEWRYLYALRKRIRELPGPATLLEQGMAEQSYSFSYTFRGRGEKTSEFPSGVPYEGEEYTVDCRNRWDFVDPERRLHADLKTCESLNEGKIKAAFARYGYPFKSIHYTNAMANLLGEGLIDWRNPVNAPPLLFLCVSKKLPIEVELRRIPEHQLAQIAIQYHDALELFCKCKASGVWPGKPHIIQDLELPKYALPNVA